MVRDQGRNNGVDVTGKLDYSKAKPRDYFNEPRLCHLNLLAQAWHLMVLGGKATAWKGHPDL